MRTNCQCASNRYDPSDIEEWTQTELTLCIGVPSPPSPGVISVMQMTVANELVPENPVTGQGPASSRTPPTKLQEMENSQNLCLCSSIRTCTMMEDILVSSLNQEKWTWCLFILGSLKALQLALVLKDDTEPFLHHLMMLMTLADYIKTNMLVSLSLSQKHIFVFCRQG